MKETKEERCETCKGIGRVIDQRWYEESCKDCGGFGKRNVPIEVETEGEGKC